MRLHVVSFQVPYPADYGGAIDVFYKLKWLHDEGHSVTLHTYVYGGRTPQPALEELCSKVCYYPRQGGPLAMLSPEPYIVHTRRSPQLLANLLADDAPILFEGLHTCHFLPHPALKDRRKAVRTHNIEHTYYRLLARQVRHTWRNLYYRAEARKLEAFERTLLHADLILPISQGDAQELRSRYPGKDIRHLPCFFDDNYADLDGGTQPYILYHGNLHVEENARVAQYIDRILAPALPRAQFLLAGRCPRLTPRSPNVRLVPNPTGEEMDSLLANARVNLLVTFQPTGIKLKLLNALAKSRGHVVANEAMLSGNSLRSLCRTPATPEQLPQLLATLLAQGPSPKEIEERQNALKEKKAGISRLSLFG